LRPPIYLDYNGTTPHHPRVVSAMRPYLEQHFGNASSAHQYGRIARAAIERARSQAAEFLHAQASEILFTSGGTESNNHVLRALVKPGRHLVTTAIEHPAILAVCDRLEREGASVTRVGVDRHGQVDAAAVLNAVRPETVLVSVMHANNEVGTIQPIETIGARLRERGVLFHTDAAQSAGKIPVDVQQLHVDFLTLAGHKLYCPKGVGALYIREGVELERFLDGAGQEQGRRAGTENVLHIAGLGAACQMLSEEPHDARPLRDRLETALMKAVNGLKLNGHPSQRLPNTLNVSFPGVSANDLLRAVEARVAASAGAACHAGTVTMSATLRAMHASEEQGRGAVRFSTGRFTTTEEIDAAVEILTQAWKSL